MSQEQQITPVPGPTVYDDEQEMLNGNGGSAMVPHPQPGVPDIQGAQRDGQVEGVVEEPIEVGAPSAAEFQGPRIFVHAPRYEWHPEVHVQGLDEEARQKIMAMEELLHRFGVTTEAREQELYRRLVGSQAAHAGLVKDVHELRQFTIVKLASCASRLDSLEGAMQNCRTEVAQTFVNLEALEKRVGVVEDVLVHAGLREVRANINKTNEEVSTIRGNWEAAIVKLQGLDSEVEKVRAQLNTINQELTTKMTDDRVLLMKQSGQVEKVETTLGEIQATQSTLVTVMEKIQNYVMQDGDLYETHIVE